MLTSLSSCTMIDRAQIHVYRSLMREARKLEKRSSLKFFMWNNVVFSDDQTDDTFLHVFYRKLFNKGDVYLPSNEAPSSIIKAECRRRLPNIQGGLDLLRFLSVQRRSIENCVANVHCRTKVPLFEILDKSLKYPPQLNIQLPTDQTFSSLKNPTEQLNLSTNFPPGCLFLSTPSTFVHMRHFLFRSVFLSVSDAHSVVLNKPFSSFTSNHETPFGKASSHPNLSSLSTLPSFGFWLNESSLKTESVKDILSPLTQCPLMQGGYFQPTSAATMGMDANQSLSYYDNNNSNNFNKKIQYLPPNMSRRSSPYLPNGFDRSSDRLTHSPVSSSETDKLYSAPSLQNLTMLHTVKNLNGNSEEITEGVFKGGNISQLCQMLKQKDITLQSAIEDKYSQKHNQRRNGEDIWFYEGLMRTPNPNRMLNRVVMLHGDVGGAIQWIWNVLRNADAINPSDFLLARSNTEDLRNVNLRSQSSDRWTLQKQTELKWMLVADYIWLRLFQNAQVDNVNINNGNSNSAQSEHGATTINFTTNLIGSERDLNILWRDEMREVLNLIEADTMAGRIEDFLSSREVKVEYQIPPLHQVIF